MKKLLLGTLISISLSLAGQPSEPKNGILSNIVPPTPTAASLGKYGEYPVNNATGTPDITIPIYEIKGKKLSLPITLSYHGSGIKVDEYASWVGLGWSLNAGGIVTRSMVGKPDEGDDFHNGYMEFEDYIEDTYATNVFGNNYSDNSHYQFLRKTALGEYDTEPDLFFYNISGESGRFIFSHGVARMIPYKPITIIADLREDNGKFEIIATDGTRYRFGVSLINEEAFETTVLVNPGHQPIHENSTWYLTEIISSDYSDTIHFKYDTHSFGYGSTLQQSISYYHNFSSFSCTGYHSGEISGVWEPNASGYSVENARKLREIRFSKGKVVFNSTTNRIDLPGDKKLNSIEIYDYINPGTPIKRFDFTYSDVPANVSGSYEAGLATNKKFRLRLDTFKEDDKPAYEFTYSNIALPPINSFRQDHWGYFNDQASNTNLIDQVVFDGHQIGGANRSPNASVMKAGSLEKIKYPTGGITEFVFEPHNTGSSNGIVGGLRIKQIKSDDGITNDKVKVFNYSYGGGGIVIPYNHKPSYNTEYVEGCGEGPNCSQDKYSVETFQPASYSCLGASGGSPVWYSAVTIQEGEDTTVNGKSIFIYSVDQDVIRDGYNPNLYIYAYPENQLYYSISNEWKRGKLLEEYHYDNNNVCKRSIVNYYSEIDNFQSADIIGLKVSDREYYIGCHTETEDGIYFHNRYHYMHSHINSKWMYIYATITTHSFDNGSVESRTDYFYDNDVHAQVTRKQVVDSKGDTLISKYKYPLAFSPTAMGGVIGTMNSQYILNTVIEEQHWKNDRIVSAKANEYGLFNGNMVLLKKTYLLETNKFLSTSEFTETDMNFNRDSKYVPQEYFDYNLQGNLTQYFKKNDLKTSIIWGYNDNYPVVKIEGIASGDIDSSIKSNISDHQYTSDSEYLQFLKVQLESLLSNASCRINMFTYKPLYGLTSETNANGITTHYQYNNYGQLWIIKNNEDNILKSFEYHYKQ